MNIKDNELCRSCNYAQPYDNSKVFICMMSQRAVQLSWLKRFIKDYHKKIVIEKISTLQVSDDETVRQLHNTTHLFKYVRGIQ